MSGSHHKGLWVMCMTGLI